MPFQKGHKLGFCPTEDEPLDTLPLSLKLRLGIRDRVRQVSGWQTELRAVIEAWLKSKEKSVNVQQIKD